MVMVDANNDVQKKSKRGLRMPYELLCVSAIGSSHVGAGTVKEDFGAVYDGGFYQIFAVADGHGDSNCPRSFLGSEFACKFAISELSSFAEILHETKQWETKLLDEMQQDKVLRQLISSIFGNWSDAVLTDFENRPLSVNERAGCRKYIDWYDKGEMLQHIYGTTLIAGLVTDSYLLLLQQGDGRCDVFSYDGDVVQPIPWDDRCFANVCTSLCDDDAVERCRYYVEDIRTRPISAVLAASDGIEDSFFSMDQVHTYFREQLIFSAENSVFQLQECLKDSLSELSARGSSDDVTICGFIDIDRICKLVSRFQKDNYQCEMYEKVAQIDERLKSIQGKYEYDLSRYEAAQDEYRKAKDTFDTLDKSYHEEGFLAASAALCEGKQRESRSFLPQLIRVLPNEAVDALLADLESMLSNMQARIATAQKDLTDTENKLKLSEREYRRTNRRKEDYLSTKQEYLDKIAAYKLGKADASLDEADDERVSVYAVDTVDTEVTIDVGEKTTDYASGVNGDPIPTVLP